MATIVDDRIGLVIDDRYRLVALIGDGGSARVYLADAVRLRRRVAVKILRPGLVDDPRFLHQFATEGEVIASLQHQNIVVVHDSGETEDGPYLVTEYLAGGSLKAMLDQGHRLTPPQAVRIGAQAAAGLGAAHRAGLVHRDVKPGNLLFDSEGRLKVADFGVARALSGAARTEPDAFAPATARYTAPDRLSSGRADPRSDVYSLCLTIVEAVTGEVPFAGPDLMVTFDLRRAEAVPVPAEFGPARAILARAGSPDPDERPDAAELAEVLGRAELLATRIDPLPLVGAVVDDADTGADTRTTVHPAAPIAAVAGALADPAGTDHSDGVAAVALPHGESTGTPATRRSRASQLPPHPADRRRRRRRRWLARTTGLLLLAALAAVAAVAVTTVQEPGEPTAILQGFVGGNIDEVRSAAGVAGWVLGEREVRSDEASPGTVVDQRPAAGTRLPEGSTITVDVVIGPYLVLAPRLAGLEEAVATARLEARGLVVADRTETFHEVIPAGAVVEALVGGEVDPGLTLREPGTGVTLVVSLGPQPRPVPELAGLDVEQARATLAGVQLALGAVNEEFSETVEAGLVTGQSVAAGDSAARDSAVDVTVSKGPDRRSVPALDGLTIDQATEALENVGLVRGGVEGSGLVVRFSEPAAGALLPPGSEVVLFAPG
jgi:eukaryotic-like serine/threonine-protein kinase